MNLKDFFAFVSTATSVIIFDAFVTRDPVH